MYLQMYGEFNLSLRTLFFRTGEIFWISKLIITFLNLHLCKNSKLKTVFNSISFVNEPNYF